MGVVIGVASGDTSPGDAGTPTPAILNTTPGIHLNATSLKNHSAEPSVLPGAGLESMGKVYPVKRTAVAVLHGVIAWRILENSLYAIPLYYAAAASPSGDASAPSAAAVAVSAAAVGTDGAASFSSTNARTETIVSSPWVISVALAGS